MPVKASSILLLILIVLLPGCGKKDVKPNILLITVDTLRKDYVGCYGFPLETTPFIDRLAKEGVRFENVVTPIPLTDGSHASILTALHPLTHQVIRNASHLDDKVETIAETLKKNGYYTIGAVAVKHLTGEYNFSQGFDAFSDKWLKRDAKFNKSWYREAGSVNKSLIRRIDEYLEKYKNNEKPLFMWVHYYDPHAPYDQWEGMDIGTTQIKDRKINREYAGEIRYADNHIRALYRYLEEKGLTKELVTCITSDHGEQLGEHGYNALHNDFYSETTFVPLVFHGYGIPQNITVRHHVSTMDIPRTLLGRAGLDFQGPVTGAYLLDSKGRPNPPSKKERDFLVIGDPRRVRSLQLIGPPLSYIMNFDFPGKYWYISLDAALPGETFKPVPQEAVTVRYYEKSGKEQVSVEYPHTLRKGLHFGVLRFDVTTFDGLAVGFIVGPGNEKSVFQFDKPTTGTVTAYVPLTPLDRLTFYINRKRSTGITGLRYAVIPGMELPGPSFSKIKIKSDVYRALRTHRRFWDRDQVFNLDTDFKMLDNLIETGDYTAEITKGQKNIYRYLKFYWNEKMKVLGKTTRSKPLTKKETDMLKTLGYL